VGKLQEGERAPVDIHSRQAKIPNTHKLITPFWGARSSALPAAYSENRNREQPSMRPARTVLAVVAAASLAGGTLAIVAEAANPTVNINEKEWTVKRGSPVLKLVHGKSYTIAVRNTGRFTHDLLIDGHGLEDVGVHNAAPITAGKSKSFTVKFPKPGTYDFYCAIPGHRAKGMELKVIVS